MPPRAVLFRQLRHGELAGFTAHPCRLDRICVGALYPVRGMDHHPVLVYRRILRGVGVRLYHQGRARYARKAAVDRAGRGGDLLHFISAAVYLHQTRADRLRRVAVWRAGELR